MIFIGVIGASGFLCCFFTAYRIASPAVVSPFEYSILVWAYIEWMDFFFDEVPNVRTCYWHGFNCMWKYLYFYS